MGALTKSEIADRLTYRLKFKREDAKSFVELFFETISLALEEGHHVRLSGFGNFCLRDKAERPGRNPKTGMPVKVSARRVVTFKSGKKLKRRVHTQI